MNETLVRMSPKFIQNYWEKIKEGLIRSGPDALDKGSLPNILKSLLLGDLQCWTMIRGENHSKEVYAFVLTAFVYDIGTKDKSLLIYSVASTKSSVADEQVYKDAFKEIKAFAKRSDCKFVLAYTRKDSVKNLVIESLGWDNKFYTLAADCRK